jgi:hypothetical protein
MLFLPLSPTFYAFNIIHGTYMLIIHLHFAFFTIPLFVAFVRLYIIIGIFSILHVFFSLHYLLPFATIPQSLFSTIVASSLASSFSNKPPFKRKSPRLITFIT